jgi:hypothetical protein
MTDAAGAPRDDLQRPLDECEPAPADAAAAPAGMLRDAAPTTPPGTAAATPAAAVSWTAVGRAVTRGLRHTGWTLWHGPGRMARALIAWSRNPTGRLAVPSVAVLGLIAIATTAGAVVIPATAPPGVTGASPADLPRPTSPAGDDTPVAAPPVTSTGNPAAGGGSTGIPSDVLRGWAQQMSARTGIPVVALQAYGYAELVVAETTPGCQLSWTTLAAIGRVESDHGRTGGATLGADGRAWPAIIGPPLDGQGNRKLIRDTDGGAIDGDDVYDRAVGPMQFIPQTWLAEQIDATGDGVADPHNIHDAALAAANYLCRDDRDLSVPDDWWRAVLAYNDVQAYAEEVFTAANEYGRASHG